MPKPMNFTRRVAKLHMQKFARELALGLRQSYPGLHRVDPLLQQVEEYRATMEKFFSECEKEHPDFTEIAPRVFEWGREARYERIIAFVEAWVCEHFQIPNEQRTQVQVSFDDSAHNFDTRKFVVEFSSPLGLIFIEVTEEKDEVLSCRELIEEEEEVS